jgi:hypothetical protein
VVEFRHVHRLVDPAGRGLQIWQVRMIADDQEVVSLRATRGLSWQAGHLRERMADEGSFLTVVAGQLLNRDGSFSSAFEEFVEIPGDILVIDQLDVSAPWVDPLIIAGVVSSVIDRLTDNHFAVVLPRAAAPECAGAHLLDQAGDLLSAEPFSDELRIIDNALAAPETAAHGIRERLRDRALYGEEADSEGGEDEGESSEDEVNVLTARTAAVLRLALEDLAAEAWQEATALGDEPLPRGAGGVFGSLPPVTLRQGSDWRRQMARAFLDLAEDLAAGPEVEPRCTGEEMALHLGIARADHLTRNRPRYVGKVVAELPEDRRDYAWDACSDVLFEDHDVLMLFDAALDGVEDSSGEANEAMGMINLAPVDWFTPFGPDLARDPDRRFPSS